MGVIAGLFLASILLKEMRYLVYIRYLWSVYLEKLIRAVCLDFLILFVGNACFELLASTWFVHLRETWLGNNVSQFATKFRS
jgi:hypothetical protein